MINNKCKKELEKLWEEGINDAGEIIEVVEKYYGKVAKKADVKKENKVDKMLGDNASPVDNDKINKILGSGSNTDGDAFGDDKISQMLGQKPEGKKADGNEETPEEKIKRMLG